MPAKVFQANVDNTSNISRKPNSECIICNANHFFLFCPTYKNKTPKQREELVGKLKRCYNCLGPHFITQCNSTKTCQTCHKKHHTSLHIKGFKIKKVVKSNDSNDIQNPSTSSQSTVTESVTLSTQSWKLATSSLLPTAVIKVSNSFGCDFLARALIDQCSQASFISRSLL